MRRAILSLLLGIASIVLPGCCIDGFKDWGGWGVSLLDVFTPLGGPGPTYTVDTDKLGPNDQAIVPHNDSWYSDEADMAAHHH